MTDNTQNRIVFLSVPESLKGQIESMQHHHDPDAEAHEHEEFNIDPGIPIPVEIPPGQDELKLEELSWEMILSGMIRVVAEDPNGEDSGYYRRFVLAVKPGIFGEFNEAAILKARNGDFEIALDILSALEGLFPRSEVVFLNRALVIENWADVLEKSGREEAAEKKNLTAEAIYGELLSRTPPFPNGLFNAGFFYMKRRNFRRAKECFEAYVSLNEGIENDKKENAGAVLKEIAGGGLDDDSFREAYDLIRSGSETEGLKSIRSFLERHPDVWNGWFLLGWALRRLGRWDDGEAAFRKALELGGGTSDTRNELAICLMETEDFGGARRELETALKDEPENTKIISNLGVLAMKQGDDAEAAAFFRAVLELDPDDPVAREFLAL